MLTRAATEAVERIFRNGYRYSKAEILLLDLRHPGKFTDDLFAVIRPGTTDRIIRVMEDINGRWGRGTVRSVTVPEVPDWEMQRNLMSQSYTTRVGPVVDCEVY